MKNNTEIIKQAFRAGFEKEAEEAFDLGSDTDPFSSEDNPYSQGPGKMSGMDMAMGFGFPMVFPGAAGFFGDAIADSYLMGTHSMSSGQYDDPGTYLKKA